MNPWVKTTNRKITALKTPRVSGLCISKSNSVYKYLHAETMAKTNGLEKVRAGKQRRLETKKNPRSAESRAGGFEKLNKT
jgi:hypothetical protein